MFPNLNFQIFLKIDLITAYGMPVLFTLYLKSLFKADVHKKILKIIIYLGVAIVLFILFTQSWINKKLEIVFILYAMLSGMYLTFIYLPILYIKKYQYVLTAFIGIFLFFATGVNDVLSTLTIINTPFLMHYGLVIYIISQFYLLSIKSAENLKSVETLSNELKYNNENLEIIVKERTQEIESQKEELFTQKEEILATNDELYELNNKLEKFSVVVSQTDNSVIITDPKGIIEWTNQRFEKVLEIDNVIGKSIFDITVNNDFAILFNKCIESKSSMVYTSEFTKDDKILIWTTTLTPILDEENVITGIVAIDSDITEIQNASKKIEHQNKLIKQSIQSALTIQQAMLPSQTDISRFYQNFIIFKPKDIVSGDFYWFLADNYSSKNEKTQTTFIAAVDCTGHGVPGAFMSMIGNSLLNKIVIEQKIANPSEIITRLDLEIIKMLKQELTNNQDGLDICFCKIILCENEKINVVFCGAKLPIYYNISGTNTIEKIKGDVKSVGGAKHKNKSQFENKEFILNKNDQIFLTTDGFVDQNNFERRRFGFTNFSSVLINCTKLSINEQKDYMLKELAIWQKNEEQRDDITVIGIKF
jgi:PAS domain S-box-containing protein